MTECKEPLDVFVYHLQRGDAKGLNDSREWGAFRLFGWTKDYDRVCIVVRNTPAVAYLELRPNKSVIRTRPGGWNGWVDDIRSLTQRMRPQFLSEQFQNVTMGSRVKYGQFRWKSVEYVEKVLSTPGRYQSDPENPRSKLLPVATPLLRLEFESIFSMRDFERHIREDYKMKYDERLDIYIHETDSWIDLPIRCFARHNMPPSGWMQIKEYVRYDDEYREFYEADHQQSRSGKKHDNHHHKPSTPVHHWCRSDVVKYDLEADWSALCPMENDPPPLPPRKLMVFDIETYSSRSVNRIAYPEFTIPDDCVFQISIVISRGDRLHDPPSVYLLSLKEPNKEVVGEDCQTIWCKDEYDLLSKFIPFVDECDVFTGWNILDYDWEYIYRRCVHHDLEGALLGVGWLENHQGGWRETQGAQTYKYVDILGKLQVDMLPIVRRNYSGLRNYKLNTVLTKFKMPMSKDDLPAQEMFRLFRIGRPEDMGRIGHYCKVDSVVCLDLWKRLNIWIGLLEMSKLTGVGLLSLYTLGTQIQTATGIVRVLWQSGRVLGCLHGYDPQNPLNAKKVDDKLVSGGKRKIKKYAGATVFKAVPGMYQWVVVLDFASLYPSIMRARNLDYSTLVDDDVKNNVLDPNVPDELCNIIDCSSHINCEHDPSRKKLKNGEWSKAQKMTLCHNYHYRWLKEDVVGEALLPKLLTSYLTARKTTKKRMDMIRETQLLPLIAGVIVHMWKRLQDTPNTLPCEKDLSMIQDGNPIFTEIMHNGEKEQTLNVVRSEWSKVVELAEKEVCVGLNESELVERVRSALMELVVLDKRQLAYKICANACYGATGASDGMVPMEEIAASTTAQGRRWISHVATWAQNDYGADCVYGDTDSVFLVFPKLNSADKATTINNVSKLIEPMLKDINSRFGVKNGIVKLEFEKIFEDLILLTKKRYLGNLCDQFGVFQQKLLRGCALVRRNFVPLTQDLYRQISDRMLAENARVKQVITTTDKIFRWIRVKEGQWTYTNDWDPSDLRSVYREWYNSLCSQIAEYILTMFHRRHKLSQYILSCGLARPRAGYGQDKAPNHILLWDRVEARQDQFENGVRIPSHSKVFSPGMRMEYVAIETPVLPIHQQFSIDLDSYNRFIQTEDKLLVHHLEELEYYQQWKDVIRLNLFWYMRSNIYRCMQELMTAVFRSEDWFDRERGIMEFLMEVHEVHRETCELILKESRTWIHDQQTGRLVFVHPCGKGGELILDPDHSRKWYVQRILKLSHKKLGREDDLTIHVPMQLEVMHELSVLWRPYVDAPDALTYLLPRECKGYQQ
jgi:DNA polymerase elongation subunit (family B)